MDTVNLFFTECPPENIQKVKRRMIQYLLNHKVMHKFRFQGRFLVAVDGTGVHCYDYEPFPNCPYKESKKGKKTYMVHVLEAKLVCSNGFSFSLETEWIQNEAVFDKQDCEQKAFIRLSGKLNKDYPRLPMLILADGLYPNGKVFDICQQNQWPFLFTFKDGNLKTVWKDIEYKLLIEKENTKQHFLLNKKEHQLTQRFRWLNGLLYQTHSLNWVECIEKERFKEKSIETRFVHITSLEISEKNVIELSGHARMRWKIENEGFNTQKNLGYQMQHKFSRRNFNAMQNYYQCLQIAHIIHQLVEKAQSFQRLLHAKDSYQTLWLCLISWLMLVEIESELLDEVYKNNCQLRY
jgi:hypothetical protein